MKNVAKIGKEMWAGAATDAVQRTADIARRALKAPMTVITCFSDSDQCVLAMSKSETGASSLNPTGYICREVYETGRPFIFPDRPSNPRYAALLDEVLARAYIGVPIKMSGDREIGALCALDGEPHDWTREDLELLTELAAVLASQLELKHETTQRGRAEEALNVTRARLLAVADRIPGLVFERRKTRAGRSEYEFFGSTKISLPAVREMMTHGSASALRFIHRDDRDLVRAALLRSNLEETDLDLTFRIKGLDHTTRWIRSQSLVRREGDGTICWDGICFDITDLVTAREEAERVRAAKDTLLVNVNHELRSPLQAIIGFTDLLKRENQPDLVSAHAQNIQAAAHSLLAIVNQLLSQAGGEDQLPQAMARVELKTFGSTCLSLLGPSAAEKRLSLRFEMNPDVPATVFIDTQKLQQAVVNLLNNAVKFTEEGGVTLRIARAPIGLRFSVIDTGIGIPEAKRDLLFQRFSRLEPDDLTVEGSGLGLSITKSLVEEMEGVIGVERHAGRGTTFWFDLPLRLAPTTAFSDDSGVRSNPLAARNGAGPSPPARKAKRILLADDLDLNRKLIADMLGVDGHVVECVTNGAEAIAAAGRQVYDLILMDVIMPEVDGIAATRAIRALPAPFCEVPIVALTANSFNEQLDICLEAGMNATLVKPMSMDDLASAVVTWTTGRDKAA